LFEYQGKQYFARYSVPVPAGGDIADTVDDAVALADRIGYPVVIKAQVQVGGRGKAGGIKIATTTDEAREHAGKILGLDIKGHVVRRLWVERASDIRREYYASFTLDRSARKFLGMLSAEGGIEIEKVAENNPAAIARIHIDPIVGLTEEACREWVARANLPEAADGVAALLLKLYGAFVQGDAELMEINPLIVNTAGEVYALDAKVTLDEAAAHRHPDWAQYEQKIDLDGREKLASDLGLQYVGLDGYIGIIANGAGLAMSTLDIVQQVGGAAANFLDIGGGAKAEVVANALKVINTDPNVRAIFINIFGGVTRGEEVAKGIIEGLRISGVTTPMVVRLDGTNATEGRAILAANKTANLYVEPTMLDAARKAIELAGGAKDVDLGG
jgi:succinyl-CoA synthetase beta subunit